MINSEVEKIIGRLVSDNVMQTDSRYEAEKNSLLDELSEIGLDALAIHEAGHVHYFRPAGALGFRFEPPVVLFRRDNMARPFKKQHAATRILPPFEKPPSDEDAIWLLKVAKGYAAGGVCSTKIANSRYRGDRTDRCLWDEFCSAHYKSSLTDDKIKSIADEYWNRAKHLVSAELDGNDPLESEIRKCANEIKPDLFPWTLLLDDRL